ncbi:Nitrate-induced NOI protein [Zea mays]|uniref:Nitrate-induced NOI protein n=1 Tax=Zea mays TaxID=4577 RepID=A0A1D6DYY7_MAIZE|nr:Nitrate-induced NOI protein [Zea mays]
MATPVVGQQGARASAAQVWGVGREESGHVRGLHRHIPEGPRRQEDHHRPWGWERARRHSAGLQERRRRRRVQARLRRRQPVHAAQTEEVGLLWLLNRSSLCCCADSKGERIVQQLK